MIEKAILLSLTITSLICHPLDKKLFPSFESFKHDINGTTIVGVRGGSGPPLLLLHGHPQSHFVWWKVANEMAKNFTVIAPDLRGYGNSSAPPSSKSHWEYSKRVMAEDQVLLMEALGFEKFQVCAHDRGARVAHRMAVDYPDKVERMMLLDIAPTLAMYEKTDLEFASLYWHWFFLIQDYPLPENFINANPDYYIEMASDGTPEVIQAYKQSLRDPKYVHSICEDYRASATIDLIHDREDRKTGRKVQSPLRVLWGADGVVGHCFNVTELWAEVALNVSGRQVPGGHDIPEGQSELLIQEIKGFFKI